MSCSRVLAILIATAASVLHAEPPQTFDLRDVDGVSYVTSVKSQSGGTCWTHGAMAAMEGNLLMTGNWDAAGETGEPNLAEYHLDWWNGFNQFNNDDTDPPTGGGLIVHQGGDYRVTAAYLARGEGAVRDVDGQSFFDPPERHLTGYHHFYPKDIEWYTVGEGLTRIDLIKQRLMTDGVVGTSMYYASTFMFNYIHYQPPADPTDPNHAVAIVGWDDTLTTQAPEKGAWLCKNSWGAGWGNDGYFWISYYDKHCGHHPEMGAVSFRDVEPLQYDRIYYHDYHGWRDTRTDIARAFNAFVATGHHRLRAVSLFTAADSALCEVKIYRYFEGGELIHEVSQGVRLCEYQGLHTIVIDPPLDLEPGVEFYVMADISRGGQAIDCTSEVPVLLGAKAATVVESRAGPGQSYYHNGLGWVDLHDDEDKTANFCIKGLASTYLTILLPDGVPRYILPEEPTTINIRLRQLADSCLPDRALLHYRVVDGEFETLPLVPTGGEMYTATLPAALCGMSYEYYLSAEGDFSGVVSMPPEAPDELYSVSVGGTDPYFQDDFRDDLGWTVVNCDSLTSGAWERVWPSSGGTRGDPPTDCDGSHYCFVTGDGGYDNDVDGGSTTLISPTYDLSAFEAEISYARWYYNAPENQAYAVMADTSYDVMTVWVSNDDGATWHKVETVRPDVDPQARWIHNAFRVSHHVTPTDRVKVKFVVADLAVPQIIEAGVDDFRIARYKCQPGDCCGVYTGGYTGNVDCSGDGMTTLSDVMALVDHLYLSRAPLCCQPNANTNGSPEGKITLSDLTRLIDQIYISKQPCELCPQQE